MPKWIVRTYLPDQDDPAVDEFDDDAQKNAVVEALRSAMRTGEVRVVEVEEPATGGLSRIT